MAELTTEQRQRQQQIITDQQLITHPEKIVGMPAQKFQELLTLADETAAIGEAVNYHFQTPARPNDDGSDGILYISVSAGKIVNAGLYDTLMN